MPPPVQLRPQDYQLIESRLRGFVPTCVFDAHVHLLHPAHFAPDLPPPIEIDGTALDFSAYQNTVKAWLGAEHLEGLFFGFPRRGNNRDAINNWIEAQVKAAGGCNRALVLAAPGDDRAQVANWLQAGFVGIKPYHCYAEGTETTQSPIEAYAPEWMWELCHEVKGVLMLHLVRDRAVADENNAAALRRLCRAYPECRVVLAHVGRSFNYRHALDGLPALLDLDNVWLDTSAITEALALHTALKTFGPQRLLFGTDSPVSELRGKCATVADRFLWLHPETSQPSLPSNSPVFTLVGIESLLCLSEAAEICGLNADDIQDIFCNNALKLLAPHLTYAP